MILIILLLISIIGHIYILFFAIRMYYRIDRSYTKI